MKIKFLTGAYGLGYAYKKGSVAASLPLKDCQFLVDCGVAEIIEEEPKKEAPKTKEITKAEVKTADVKRKYTKKQ